jgi:signal transduction histidine kinase
MPDASSPPPAEIGLAERELAAMQRDLHGALRQKTRLAALGAALARIQHDLRNLLSTAQLASDRLAEIDDPAARRLAPRLVASIGRAVTLATTTLRYGHAEERAPERRRVALKSLIEEASEAALEAGAANIALTCEIDAALHVDADPEQLFRMVLNLLRNAAQALADKSGAIVVRAEHIDGGVRIDIADTGPGIAPGVQGRLFQPFASARLGGSGLGLAIVRDLARLHGGEVMLVSTGPKGTCFRLELPDAKEV